MDKSPSITIPAPIAVYGERVEVLNTHKKLPVWEPGQCLQVEYKMYQSSKPREGYWLYRVRLDRRTKKSPNMFLYATDEKIKSVQHG